MLIAQVSDLHIRRPGELVSARVDTAGCLARCVACLNRLDPRPDLAALTGDLVDGGHPEEYRHLRRLLEPLAMPYYVIPGNHDSRGPLREGFADHDYLRRDPDFLHYVIEEYPLRLVFLDTVEPGQEWGRLDQRRTEWLEQRLAEAPERPTLVFMHHPPFDCGIADIDRIRCRDAEPLAGILRRNPQVERLCCGHVHRAVQTRWAGVPACIAPSSAHQLYPDLRTDGAHPVRLVLEPPGFLLHLWRPGMGVVTHACVAGPFDGPYDF
jgi:3',5'-cyclic AMP phosphodiesterase CpdA